LLAPLPWYLQVGNLRQFSKSENRLSNLKEDLPEVSRFVREHHRRDGHDWSRYQGIYEAEHENYKKGEVINAKGFQ